MLQRITIHNLALIRDLEIEFSDELNVFSGETGAGKSIIVDSLMLLVGARYDKSLIKFGAESGYVEGVFDFKDDAPLIAAGIGCEDGIFIVTRKFTKDGRNDIRVNGKQMTTAMLRELMQNYVDIYGQNEYQSLMKITEQRKILDYFVFKTDDARLKTQRELYNEYKKVKADMTALGDEAARAQRIDILKYQIDEIKAAAVQAGEEEKLVERRHVLMAAERIKNALADGFSRLDSDDGASGAVADAGRSLSSISSLGEEYAQLYERLRSVQIELDDIAECIKDELDGMDGSERELDEVSDRLDKLRALKAKYGGYEAMQKFLANAEKELDVAQNGAEYYEELCEKESKLRKALYENSVAVSALRRDGAARMSARILAELADLGMANSAFEVVFAPQPSYDDFTGKVNANGFDECEFYLSPNVGQPLLPLAKIISGGEMSRFMLAIKLITGDLSAIETMIFDEIDAGISGATGLCVAKKLAELSRGHQVLCVTHLPQIAAMADGHYYIEKYETDGDTTTRVTALGRDGMIGEISRLSGTKGVSTSSDKNATELKDWSDAFKAELVGG
ncbi:DNA repair protein RecN [Anaerocaecibacter muris]|uniref:DNA repair protein RecN n=1 Tax=Anaerocaecibacter muris TaxID=2941513 RepID=UPI003F690DA7